MFAQIIWLGDTIAEVSYLTKYFAEALSINSRRSVKYGLGCLATAAKYRLAKAGFLKTALFPRRHSLQSQSQIEFRNSFKMINICH
jgi:hypothetical protein